MNYIEHLYFLLKKISKSTKVYYVIFFLIISVLTISIAYISYDRIEGIITKRASTNAIYENWLIVKNQAVKYFIFNKDLKPDENIDYNLTYNFIKSVSNFDISMESLLAEELFNGNNQSEILIIEETAVMILIWQNIQFELQKSFLYRDNLDLFVNELLVFITETDDFEISIKKVIREHERFLNRTAKISWFLFIITAGFAFFVIIISSNFIYNYFKVSGKEKQIRKLSASLIKIRDNERKRIAIDLHDIIVQNLLVIKRFSDEIIDDSVESKVSIGIKIKEISEKAIDSVREISFNLRPSELTQPIVESIRSYCNDVASKSKIDVDFFSFGLDGYNIDNNLEINIYRLIHESVNNILNHANATKIIVRIILSFPNILLKIEDNGKGFILTDTYNKNHMGLKGMEDRVGLIGGTINIRSVNDIGTLISFKIPCKGLINEKL